MITLLIGENSFEIEQALDKIKHDFTGTVEKIDGSQLQLSQLPDVLMGVSLFAVSRVVVIRGLSQNKSVWSVFGDWANKISDDIHLVLVEPKVDKRTATFKKLKEKATVKELQPFSDRDLSNVEKWVSLEAEKLSLKLDKKSIQFLVARVGFDQWQLFYALKKLTLVDDISIGSIEDIIDLNPDENVFILFETALRGDRQELKRILRSLEQTEDAFRLLSLLSVQAFQLFVVSTAEKSDNVAKDFGIHPFVVSKLAALSKRIGYKDTTKIIDIFVCADDDIKLSKADPWILIERALLKVASL